MKHAALLVAGMLSWAQPQEPPKGSISGVVRELGTGQPMPDVGVSAGLGPPNRPVSTTTDSQGRFTLRDVPPGRVTINAQPAFVQGQGFPAAVSRVVNLSPGQTLESIEMTIRRDARLSGAVMDQNDEPVPDASVILVSREYQLGQMRYIFSSVARTDDEGNYSFPRVTPGRAYILMMLRFTQTAKAISDAPLDPAMRRPAYAPTYYPGVPNIEGAQLVTLQAGEHRENMNLRVERTPSFCAAGTVRLNGTPGVARIRYMPARPHSGSSGNGGLYMGGNSASTGPDGRFRICDLAPGDYTVTAYGQGDVRGSLTFAVKDRDVAFELYASPKIETPGELVWAEAPPEGFKLNVPNNWYLSFVMMSDSERGQVRLTGIGPFTISPMAIEEFWTEMTQLPPDTYIREIMYAGHNLIFEPFRPGSATGEQAVRLVIGRNGGLVRVAAADEDGKPLPDHYVTVVPVAVRSEIEFADAAESFMYNSRIVAQRQTDQNGSWTSQPLAPGKYYVYASSAPFDRTPETVAKYWQVRDRAKQVELPAGATIEAAVVPLQ